MIDAINPDLKSVIVNQFGKPIVKTGEALHKNTIIVNENTQTHVEQNEEIKASFLNIKKFNQTFEGSGGKFAAGLKELTGGFIDLQDMSETTSKKFKAIGDIGSSLLTPFKAVGNLFAEKTEEEKKEEAKAKEDKLKKLKLQKEDNKNTKEKNKQSKGFLGNLKIFSLKFALIAGVAALVVVGLMKLVKFFSENGALQTVFNFIGSIIGRVQNIFDAVVLGINAAAAAVPWYDGFLSKQDIDEINERMGKRILTDKFKSKQSKDADRVAEIRAEEEVKGDYKTQAELNRKIDARAAEEGLLTNRMVMLTEEEGGGVGIKSDDGSYKRIEEELGAGSDINTELFKEVGKRTGNEDIKRQVAGTLGMNEEDLKKNLGDDEYAKLTQAKALGIVKSGALDKQRKRVENAQAILTERENTLATDPDNPRYQKGVDSAKIALQKEQDKLKYMFFILDEFKRLDAERFDLKEGRSAEDVLEQMKMGKGSDDRLGGGEKYARFDSFDMDREFDDYLGEENALTGEQRRSFFHQGNISSVVGGNLAMLKEAREVGVDEMRHVKQKEYMQGVAGQNLLSNFSTYVDAKSYTSSEYYTENLDIKN